VKTVGGVRVRVPEPGRVQRRQAPSVRDRHAQPAHRLLQPVRQARAGVGDDDAPQQSGQRQVITQCRVVRCARHLLAPVRQQVQRPPGAQPGDLVGPAGDIPLDRVGEGVEGGVGGDAAGYRPGEQRIDQRQTGEQIVAADA
jgi:hypothetical protein